MKDLVILVLVVASVSAFMWWRRRRHRDPEIEARRSRLIGAPSPRQSVLQLARVEAFRLHVHPGTIIGLALMLSLGPLAIFTSERIDLGTAESDQLLVCVLFAWGALVASACAVLRSRRHHTDELFATLPMTIESRTAAHLLATASLMIAGAIVTALVFIVSATSGFGTPRWSIVALGPVLIVGAAVLGVAVARWVPLVGAAFAACLATIIVQANFHQQSPQWRWLHFLVYADVADQYRELEIRHDEWHLVFVVASIGVPVAVALLRSGWTRRVATVFGASALVLVVSGVAQLRAPGSEGVASAAARLERPVDVQSCATRGAVTVCVWPRLDHVRPALLDVAARVVAAAPPAAVANGITVAMKPYIDVRTVIDPAVARAVDPSIVFGRDQVVAADYGELREDDAAIALAYRTAVTIVGLPDTVWWADAGSGSTAWTTQLLARNDTGERIAIASPLTTCSAAGEARGVVAGWLTRQASLATRRAGSVATQRALGDWVDLNDHYENFTYRIPDPTPTHGTMLLAADWLAAAWLSENVDTADVQRVLAANWPLLMDPATPSARLFALGGWAAPAEFVSTRTPTGRGAVITPRTRCADAAP
ncbi:MAG TPA: hypothetical protein VM282_00135 [Acidimicrobiales bacterium]|nr:hypothetical protein [Acidimicrobiales bacterium]